MFRADHLYKQCDEVEKGTIDTLIVRGALKAGQLDKATVHSLFKKGLIYCDIPISPEDTLSLPDTSSTITWKGKTNFP